VDLLVACWTSLVPTLINTPSRSHILDWYRGVGILAVLWGHASLPGLPAAYLMIDTFFVISGYLVSRSLTQAVANQDGINTGKLGPPLRVFFAARIRRIIIPLAATVLLSLIAGWFIFLPDDLFALAQSAQATLLLQAHLYALTLGSYFDVVGGNTPLLHAWSLSLEEWFYILTPLLVLPALIWSRLWWLMILGAVALLSLYTAQVMSSDPDTLGASYSLLRTRIWQFVVGAMVAILIQSPPRLHRLVNDGILLLAILTIFASVLLLTDKAASPGYVTLPAVFGILVILVLRPQTSALLTLTGSVWIGFLGKKIYSLYLAHYPFMIFFDYLEYDLGAWTDYIKFVLALIVSLAFYYVVEAPAQGWRRVPFAQVSGLSLVLIAGCLVIISQIKTTGGAPTRLPPEALAAWTARFDTNPARVYCVQPQLTRFGYSCALGPTDGPFFALFGDSHSEVFSTQLAHVLAKDGIGLRHYWYAECPVIGSGLAALRVFSETCTRLSHEGHRAALGDPALAGVIYAARWPWYLNDASPDQMRSYWRDARGIARNQASMEAFRSAFMTALTDSVHDFRRRGVPVFIMTPVPSLPADPVKSQVLSRWHGATPTFTQIGQGLNLDDYLSERHVFDEFFIPLAQENLASFIDVREALCDTDVCTVYGALGSLYYDDNHLNETGARKVISFLLK
jgi:peptidoglycan/LPS O-acetylase OafA/YrhL